MSLHRKTPVLVLLACLVLTIVTVWTVDNQTREREALRFELATLRIQERLLDRLESYLGIVWATAGLFEANHLDVNDAQLREFRLALESGGLSEGLVALTFVRKVEPQDFEKFRTNPGLGFTVAEPKQAPREAVYVLTHIEPRKPEFVGSLGFNPFLEETRRKAMVTAAETGRASVTDKVTLHSDQRAGSDSEAILLYAPVYYPGAEHLKPNERGRLLFGYVGASFRLLDLLDYLRQNSSEQEVGFRIYSGTKKSPETLLLETPEPQPEDPIFTTSSVILLSGHSWTLEYWALPPFHNHFALLQTPLIAVLGLLLSFTLFVSTHLQVRAREAREEALHAEQQRARDLEEQSKAKSRFFSSLNHELRTPLNGILGMSDLLYDTDLDEQQRDYLNAIGACGKSLMDLINDVLDTSKIEAGKMELRPRPVELRNIFRQAYQVVRGPAQGKGLELQFEWDDTLPRWAVLDGVRLRQVLVNLLGNAVKFTNRGQITLGAERATIEGKEKLVFKVQDTGIGISRENIDKLFRPFSQVEDDSTVTEIKGTGLGLHICRELLTMMGGSIGLESQLGQGTTFIGVIPLVERDDDPYETNRIKRHEAAVDALKILVVDDNPINRRVLTLQLSKLGHDADTASNGQESVERARDSELDVILMDCQMPGLDGLEATRQIREFAPEKPVIIALTALTDASQRDACLKAGMNAFLTKPVDLSRLETQLRQLTASS